MKLSKIKGEKALDVLADLIEPAVKIMSDKEIADLTRSGQTIRLIKPLLKNHKREVIEIMAILDGEDPDGYADKVNVFTLPKKLLEIINDKELISLFTSQGQTTDETSSGSATESIEADNQ